LKNFKEFKIIAESDNGKKALKQIKQLYPDVIFVDIDLPGLNGIDLVKSLQQFDYTPMVVFFTSYPQYAVQGFEFNALDYLVKPISQDRLAKTIEKIKKNFEETKPNIAPVSKPKEYLQYLTIQINKHSYVVNVNDIVYISVQEGTVLIKLKNNLGTVRYRSIKQLESELDPRQFVRAHRKYLVNVEKIEEIIGWFKNSYRLKMKNDNGIEIQLSRRGARALRHVVRW
jgi:two-component system, LytTR family, response regulator LytT